MWWHQAAWAFSIVTVVGPSASGTLSKKQDMRDSCKAGSPKKSFRLNEAMSIAQSYGSRLTAYPVIMGTPSAVLAFLSILERIDCLAIVMSSGLEISSSEKALRVTASV